MNATALSAKAKALRAEANDLDPDHTAPAWFTDEDEAEDARANEERLKAFMRRHYP